MYSDIEYGEGCVIKHVISGNSRIPDLSQAIDNEIKYLKLFHKDSLDFNSPMIKVPKFISFEDNKIVQEKATGTLLIDYDGIVPRKIFDELIRFFEFANSRNHYHLDISEENLIYDHKNNIMWIIDFGWASDHLPSVHLRVDDVEEIKFLAECGRWN